MSIQTQRSLEAAERSGDEVRLAEELRKAKPDVAPTVIGILERARSPRVRNAAALALADTHAANARGSLIGALRRAETRGHRGTILYALDELGANLPLSLLAGIIAGDAYEARGGGARVPGLRQGRPRRGPPPGGADAALGPEGGRRRAVPRHQGGAGVLVRALHRFGKITSNARPTAHGRR
jgi:hypothetical protein